MKRTVLLAAAVLTAALTVGAAAAGARGGPGGGIGGVLGGGSLSALVTQAASQLNVTRTKLVTAIQDAAAARISQAVADGDLPSARADDLKAEAQDNLNVAYSISETATVASKLGITATALNTGFRAARKALLSAQIDQAKSAGRITADQASTLKSRLDSATLPGYKGGLGGLGGGLHGGLRLGGPFGAGPGLGPRLGRGFAFGGGPGLGGPGFGGPALAFRG